MCLIVDINVAEAVLLKENDPDFHEIHRHLFMKKHPQARLVYGGKLADEYIQNNNIRRILLVLDRMGCARAVSSTLRRKSAKVMLLLGFCVTIEVSSPRRTPHCVVADPLLCVWKTPFSMS